MQHSITNNSSANQMIGCRCYRQMALLSWTKYLNCSKLKGLRNKHVVISLHQNDNI